MPQQIAPIQSQARPRVLVGLIEGVKMGKGGLRDAAAVAKKVIDVSIAEGIL
jgi:hypothetical protein